jgi:hypothetical protein
VPCAQSLDGVSSLGGARTRLDGFARMHFVSPDRLYLEIFRPTGPVRKPWFAPNRLLATLARVVSGRGWECSAEPRWVEVRLRLAA